MTTDDAKEILKAFLLKRKFLPPLVRRAIEKLIE